jgi:hypothetical protein
MPLTGAECEQTVCRWRYAIYAVGLVLPLAGFAGTAALLFDESTPVGVREHLAREMPWWALLYPVAVLQFSWPFYVLARVVAKQIRKSWPEIARVHGASAGALIGLTVPYLFGYWSLRTEFASGAPDAGQGSGILLGLLAPIVGCGIAVVGWFVGAKVNNPRRKDARP